MSSSWISSITSLFALSDEQAMWRVQMHDDAEAFACLLRRWQGPIQRLCTRMTGDPHRALDLTQETFARIFAKRKSYEPGGRFSSYLWRVALNTCYDELRKTQRRRESSLDEVEPESPGSCSAELGEGETPASIVAGAERAELVRAALMRLPEAYRVVVVLRHYEDLKFREIAEILQIPEGTVKSRMAEALNQLSRLLSPEFSNSERKPIPCKPKTRKHPMETGQTL